MKLGNVYPTVSVVVATFNSERTIKRCLQAVRSQKYPQENIDIIISDGGSTDDTRKLCMQFNVTWIQVDKKKQNAEYNKGIGVAKATGELLFLLDHDNIIPHSLWLSRMIQPMLVDNAIIAVETLRYAYDSRSSLIDRYFGLFGAGDPLAFYLGKSDRLSYMFDEYNLMGDAQEFTEYYKVIFSSKAIPTLGANGYIVRRKIFMKNAQADPDHFFHIDVNVDLIRKGFNAFAFVKEDILHLTGYASVWSFLQRRMLFMRQYHMGSNGLEAKSLRRYSVYQSQDSWKLVWFIFISLTIIIPLIDSMRGHRKIHDSAWFLHPFLCFSLVVLYGWVVATHMVNYYGRKLLAK